MPDKASDFYQPGTWNSTKLYHPQTDKPGTSTETSQELHAYKIYPKQVFREIRKQRSISHYVEDFKLKRLSKFHLKKKNRKTSVSFNTEDPKDPIFLEIL